MIWALLKGLIMKKILLLLSLVMFSLNANASSVGTLYQKCKPLQSNGFNFKTLNKQHTIGAVSCTSYFRALIDLGSQNCILLNHIEKLSKNDKNPVPSKVLKLLSKMTANANRVDLGMVITDFINFAEKNNHQWEENVPKYNNKFLSNKFPCTIN